MRTNYCVCVDEMSSLQASEEFDVPQVLLCITTTLSPQLFPKTVSVGVLQIGWDTDGRGGPFKGYPLLGRAKPPRPKEKLKAIVTRLHCHLRPALDDQKKASDKSRIKSGNEVRRARGTVNLAPSGVKDQEALIARCPNFSRGFHTNDRGRHGMDACPNCGVLTLDGVVGAPCPWGWTSIWAGRSGQARTSRTKPQNAQGSRGMSRSKSPHRS